MSSYLDYIHNKLNEKKPLTVGNTTIKENVSDDLVVKFKDYLSELIEKYNITKDDVNKFLKYLKEDKTEEVKPKIKLNKNIEKNNEDFFIENAVNIITDLGDSVPKEIEIDDDLAKALLI